MLARFHGRGTLTHAHTNMRAPDVAVDGVRHHGNRAVTLAVLWVDWSCGGGRRKQPALLLKCSYYYSQSPHVSILCSSFLFFILWVCLHHRRRRPQTTLMFFLLFSFFIFLCKLEAVSWSVHEEAEERSAGTFAAIDCAKSVTSSDRPAAASRQRSAWRLICWYIFILLFFALSLSASPYSRQKKYIIFPLLCL